MVRAGALASVGLAAWVVAHVPAQAALLDLGAAGSFNAYTVGNFSMSSVDTEGAIAAGGNVTATTFAINPNNVPGIGNTAVAAGGNLTFAHGGIHNGNIYAGGTISLPITVGLTNAQTTNVAPLSFAATSAHVQGVSTQLAGVAANGTAQVQFGGVWLTGSGGAGPQIFNLNGNLLSGTTYFNFANLVFGQTVVLNITGTNVTANGSWSGFANYNALVNFHQAETLTVSGWDAVGTLLAPLADLTGYGAHRGNVIVENFDSTSGPRLELHVGNYWVPTDIPGYTPPSSVPPTDVPEPGSLTLFGFGLLAIGAVNGVRRRRQAGAATPA